MSSGLSTQPRTPTAPARAATTAPLGAGSRRGPTARVFAPFPRRPRRWRRTSPSGPTTACHPHRSAWTAPRFATITPTPDTRTRATTKGCAGCCADSPAGRRARVTPRDRPPPSRRRGWPRSLRLLICGARDGAAEPSGPARPASAVRWISRSCRSCGTPCFGAPRPPRSLGPTRRFGATGPPASPSAAPTVSSLLALLAILLSPTITVASVAQMT